MPTKCVKCGAEYKRGPGGWAGLCNSCIVDLAGESGTFHRIIKPEKTLIAIIPGEKPQHEPQKIHHREPRNLREKMRWRGF